MRVFNFNFRTPASGFIGGAREHLRDQPNVSLVTGLPVGVPRSLSECGLMFQRNIELNVPVGTHKQFCWNTVEISENSENHLKAIVGWRQAAEGDGVGQVPKCRHEKRGAKGRR